MNFPTYVRESKNLEHSSYNSNGQYSRSNKNISLVSNITCWNCDRAGHAHNKCYAKKSIFCYGCGKKNTIRPKCSNCSSKNLENTGNRNLVSISSQPKPESNPGPSQ